MRATPPDALRTVLFWAALVGIIATPIALAATSSLLAWRDPIYIGAGFAGIIAMALLLLQPLLAGGYLPHLSVLKGRRIHRITGASLLIAVIFHVAGLWITSPPDVIDVLLFRSPTPFSVWGVVAMWAVLASATLAVLRHRFRPRLWRLGHGSLAAIIVTGSIIHALLIEGTMETMSKVVLCVVVALATLKVLTELKLRPAKKR